MHSFWGKLARRVSASRRVSVSYTHLHKAETVAAAQAVAAKIKGKTVTIKAKGGASGRLHGKVTGKEVEMCIRDRYIPAGPCGK